MIWNLSIRRPVLTVVIFTIIAIFGVYSYFQMPVQENPDVEFPIVSVNVILPGAAPEVVETEIVEVLEEQINTIEGLRTLSSTARDEVGNITAEFELWRDIDIAAQDIRDRIDRARGQLPTDIEPPVLRKIDPNEQPIMWISLTGDDRWTAIDLAEYADEFIKPQLENVAGVGQIMIGGQAGYAVRIKLDPERLAAHRLTVQDVVNTIREDNVDIPSGRIEGQQREFIVRTLGQFGSAEPFNDLIIDYQDGAPIRLRDVGEAVDGAESDRQLARFSGEVSAGMGVVRQSDANTVDVAQQVRERMAEASQAFPAGLSYDLATDDSVFIQENIDDLLTTIVLATLLVVLVVLAFLRSPRGTLVVAIAIPISLLTGMIGISLFGFSINTLTMLGFILVIGIVVDDAIVVLERTYWHMEQGAEARPAARVGTTEVAFPTIANTLALAAVFIPVAFTGGLIGRFFLEFGVTVAITVFASTFIALTLTPMLCSRLLKTNDNPGRLYRSSEWAFQKLEAGYAWILERAFRFRWVTVALGAAALAVGLVFLNFLPTEFEPDIDRSQIMIRFETPEGTTLAETNKLAHEIEAILADTPEVQHQFLAIGLSQAGPGQVNEGIAFVRLHPRDQRDIHQTEVVNSIRGRLAQLPQGQAFAFGLTGGGGIAGSPIEIVLLNPDLDELATVAEQVTDWMHTQPDYVNIQTDLDLNKPQIDLAIDRDRAGELGVSITEISNTARYLLGEPNISTIERNAQRYDVIPEILGKGQLSPDVLRDLYVRDRNGSLVPFDNLVDIHETVGPSEIHHHNRMRAVTISAHPADDVVLGEALAKLEDHLAGNLPAGFTYDVAGQAEIFRESFFYLGLTVIFAVVFIYLVLAAQFESFLYPLTIMTTLPLAAAGIFGALWLLGMTLNINAFIGMIVLMGLVTKNGILLIDYTNVLVARGRTAVQAAREAAAARFRPVLMTAISTILGMMPIALGYGAGAEARAPLGVAVAAGLFTSTMLTLVVVPVVYTLIDQLQSFVMRLVGRNTQESEPAGVVA